MIFNSYVTCLYSCCTILITRIFSALLLIKKKTHYKVVYHVIPAEASYMLCLQYLLIGSSGHVQWPAPPRFVYFYSDVHTMKKSQQCLFIGMPVFYFL